MRLTPIRSAAFAALAALMLSACTSSGGSGLNPPTFNARTAAPNASPDGVKIAVFTVPTAGVYPYDIALGQNGNLYFSQPLPASAAYLWQVSESGHFTAIKPSLGQTGSVGITSGAGGTVYFGLGRNGGQELGTYGAGKLAFKSLTGPAVNAIYYLKQAKDGSIWFSDPGDYKVGHIVGTKYTLYTAPTKYCSPYGITVGSDGNAWVAESCPTGTGRIGRITSAGAWKEYTLPTTGEQPYGIAAGPDRNLWYTGETTNVIGRITTGGKITQFSLAHVGKSFGTPYLIAPGNDGALWFTVQQANEIGRITTSGSPAEYAIPTCQCSLQPTGITAGAGRTIWFTTVLGNQVDKLSY